jgi:HAD superfamily hydrolase (TIGR01509 family)
MSQPDSIFLDDGGVMNDNAVRSVQARQLTGVYLAPRLGGDEMAWATANAVVFEGIWRDYLARIEREPLFDVEAAREVDDDRWLSEMCREVGVAPPPERAERLQLAQAAIAFISRNLRAAYPGAVEAIARLAADGYLLHTASGTHSLELAGYLEGMGVRDRVGTLYGPDIVNTPKASPRYYARVFEHAGVASSHALVVDDSETALDWAASVGAQTVLCRSEPPRSPRHRHIRSLAGLPELLGRINESSGTLLDLMSFHLAEGDE